MVRKKIAMLMIIGLLVLNTMFSAFAFDITQEAKNQMSLLDEEETNTVMFLFLLEQEMNEAQLEEDRINDSIQSIEMSIDGKEKAIQDVQIEFDAQREKLRAILQSYQKMGANSYLEAFFKSDSLSEFLWQINLFREFSRNLNTLMESIEKTSERLNGEKEVLDAQYLTLENEKVNLNNKMKENERVREEKEQYLTSLKEKRETFEKYADTVNEYWDKVKNDMNIFIAEVSRVLENVNLNDEFIDMKLSFSGIEIDVLEEAFNAKIHENKEYEHIFFIFEKDKIVIDAPDLNLNVIGEFEIVNATTLKFNAISGTFYSIDLDQNSLKELIGKSDLNIDLSPVLNKNKIESIRFEENKIVLKIKYSLF
ncbi:MAG: hypothetical protein JW702_08725 [Clostridiales bacterium]|nr:hypothetical protein [Clostridiales bacterium]